MKHIQSELSAHTFFKSAVPFDLPNLTSVHWYLRPALFVLSDSLLKEETV